MLGLKILAITITIVGIIEYFYSVYYKKDGEYSKKGTFANILSGVVVHFLALKFTFLYTGIFLIIWYKFLKFGEFFFSVPSFITSLLLLDFIYYIFHRMHHHFNFLWALHSVHHGDDKVNISTTHRCSWVEQLYLFLPYAPMMLIGIHPFLIVMTRFYSKTHMLLVHSSYVKFPNFISYLIVTPQTHRTHHDQNIKKQNCNFGGVFTIWDRLFGTYADNKEKIIPGTKGYHQDNFIMIQVDPVISYLKKFFR
jgi:sterol desaturase/sphingolipid hydroxylase (fatty acid hydroxylase superfamily)